MEKINILRKITCFYPGTIQLPLMKFYPLEESEDSFSEWAITRNFQALNIIDYRMQLKHLHEQNLTNPSKSYSFIHKSVIMQFKSGDDTKAVAELLGVREGVTRNVDRFFFDDPVSEILLFQYHFNINRPEIPDNKAITIEPSKIEESFERIIKTYVKATGDWTITSFNALKAPIYYEISDKYFDDGTSRDIMRTTFLSSNNQSWDLGRGEISIDGMGSRLHKKLSLDCIITDSQVSFSINNPDHDSVNANEIFTRISRDIYIEKLQICATREFHIRRNFCDKVFD